MKRNLLFYILLSLTLVGCKSTPSDQKIISLLEEKHASSSFSQVANISNIKKTNGFEETDNIYVADVEYDLITTLSFKEFEAALDSQFKKESEGLNRAEKRNLKIKIARDNRGVFAEFRKFSKGDVKHYQEKLTLLNTENGWQIKES